MHNWVTLPYRRNYHNIVNQLYFKNVKKKKKKRRHECAEKKQIKKCEHHCIDGFGFRFPTMTLMLRESISFNSAGKTEGKRPTYTK